MKQLFNYLFKLSGQLRSFVTFDYQQNVLYAYFNKIPRQTASSEAVVLVQTVESLFYYGLFGQVINSLREQKHIRVEQFVLRSLNVNESKSLWILIKSRLVNVLCSYKWTRLYSTFCDGVGYSSTSFSPASDMVDLYRAWNSWRGLSNKDALINLVVNDVIVGDLINDSFLRFKPAPMVNLKSVYLLMLIWQAHRDVRRANKYFSHTRPVLYLTSMAVYIQHGIAVRVALKQGINVFSFGNYQELTKRLTLNDWLDTRYADDYADDFLKLDSKEEKLDLAENALSARMAGVVDNATSYMRSSAYVVSGDPVPNVRNAVVVFLHDFYDSPNIYKDMIFPDFWEWACFTIDTLNDAGIRFFVKPHPNQIQSSNDVLKDLIKHYPNLAVISTSITNKQLAEAGFACAVTVYGTVAHEMAYLGVPTIACARHSHISFDFCRTARTRAEYIDLLRHYSNIDIDRARLRQQSQIFYYMHNLNMSVDEKSLVDLISEFRLACANFNEKNSNLTQFLERLSELTAYKSYISTWSNMLSISREGLQSEAN